MRRTTLIAPAVLALAFSCATTKPEQTAEKKAEIVTEEEFIPKKDAVAEEEQIPAPDEEFVEVEFVPETSSLKKIDMTKWLLNEEDGVFFQTGIPYCANAADTHHEQLAVFVPRALFDAKANGDGTYTAKACGNGAPFAMKIDTPSFLAMKPAQSYSREAASIAKSGLIAVLAGARGKGTGVGAAVADFKAAIRFIRLNADILPPEKGFFVYGSDAGGAIACVIGASGDSALYSSLLDEIGAAETTDAVDGVFATEPRTALPLSDAAFEWSAGHAREFSGADAEEERLKSENLARSFAEKINSLSLAGDDGNALTLDESGDGPYADFYRKELTRSLNEFLAAGPFPRKTGLFATHIAETEKPQGESATEGMFAGRKPRKPKSAIPNIAEERLFREMTEKRQRELSGIHDTPYDYIESLNALSLSKGGGRWVEYDGAEGIAEITDWKAFAKLFQKPLRKIGAAASDEGNFSLLSEMYDPMYFLCEKSGKAASSWRIRGTAARGDKPLTAEMNIAQLLKNNGLRVDFSLLWNDSAADGGQGEDEQAAAWISAQE